MATTTDQAAKSSVNPIIDDALKQFAAIDTDGHKKDLTGGDEYSDTTESHLQGFAAYGNYYLIAQNRHDHQKGKLYFFAADTLEFKASMHFDGVPDNSQDGYKHAYNHPGGMQVIGDYLLVPIQTQNYAHSVVQLWDLSELKKGSTAIELINGDFLPGSNDQRIGAIGIVNTGSGFVVAAGNNETIHIYTSSDTDITKAKFSLSFSTTKQLDAAGACLVTDKSGKIYLVALGSNSTIISYDDIGILYEVDLANKKISFVRENGFESHSNELGFTGVHFRWGAGIYFRDGPKLALMATQRAMEDPCTFNTWHS